MAKKKSWWDRVSIFGDTDLVDVVETTGIPSVIKGASNNSTRYTSNYRSSGYNNASNEQISAINKLFELSQDRIRKAHKEHMNRRYVDAALYFDESLRYCKRIEEISNRFSHQNILSPKTREILINKVKTSKFGKYSTLSKICSINGNFRMAKKFMTEAIAAAPVDPEAETVKYMMLDEIEKIEFIKKAIKSEDELESNYLFSMALNISKKEAVNSDRELKFKLTHDISLIEGLILIIEGLLEDDKEKAKEAKQKFDNAPIFRSCIALKLLCDSLINLLEGNRDKGMEIKNKAFNIIKIHGSYIDILLGIYCKYLIKKYIERNPKEAINILRSTINRIDKQNQHRIEEDLKRIGVIKQ